MPIDDKLGKKIFNMSSLLYQNKGGAGTIYCINGDRSILIISRRLMSV